MIEYARIVLHDGARFYLRITGESSRALRGIEVDQDGEEIVPPGADERLRIIELGAIKKRIPMRMNNHYATLEVVHP